MSSSKPLSLLLYLALAIALALPACGSREERRDAHYERAKKYLAEDKSSEGIIELKNTVQIDPEFAEAYALLGETYLKDKDFRPAFGYYNKAVELDPQNLSYVIPLGDMLAAARQFDRLDEVLGALSEESRHTFEVVRLEAAGLQMRDRGDEAAALLKGLLEGEGLTPEQRAGLDKALAQMAVRNKALKEAEEYAQAAVDEVATDVGAIVLLSRLQEARGDLQGAEATLAEALTAQPGDLRLTAGLITFLGRQDRLDDALGVLQEFTARGDLTPEGRLFAADTYLRLKKVADAEAILLAGIETEEPDARLLEAYTRLKAAQGKLDDALAVAVKAKERVEPPSQIHYDLARLYLQLKKMPEARAVVDEILAADAGDFQARVMQAQLRLFDQDAQGALDQFRELLKEAPQDPMVHAGLAGAHLALGEPLLARQELEKVVELKPDNTAARIQLARLYLQDKDTETALARLEPLAEMQAPPPQGIELLLRVLAATGKIDRAHEVIDGLVERFPENPIFATQQAVLEARTGHVDKGINLLRAQTVKYPTSVPLLLALSQLLVADNREDEAAKAYEQILALQPDHPVASIKLARRDLQDKDLDSALARLEPLAEMEAPPPQGIDLLLRVLTAAGKVDRAHEVIDGLVERFPEDPTFATQQAMLEARTGDMDKGINLLRAQTVKYPKSVPLLLSLSQLLESANRGDEAAKVYEQILAIQPDHPVATNNLAFRLAESGRDLGRAESLAKGLVERFPADPNVVDTYAWVLLKKGDAATAFDTLSKAMDGKEVQPVVHYHLAAMAERLGKREDAQREIGVALSGEPRGAWVDAAKQLQKKLEG
jgi:predicted Zn-dependent protease